MTDNIWTHFDFETAMDRAQRAIDQDTDLIEALTSKVTMLENMLRAERAMVKQLDDENRRLREASDLGMVGYV